jgi:hypothetical protein
VILSTSVCKMQNRTRKWGREMAKFQLLTVWIVFDLGGDNHERISDLGARHRPRPPH